MAISTQPQYSPEPFRRSTTQSRDDETNVGWRLKLSFGQLIVSWSAILGVMVAIYFAGFYSGEEQGLQRALDEHAQLAARFPVTPSQEEGTFREDGGGAATALSGLSTDADGARDGVQKDDSLSTASPIDLPTEQAQNPLAGFNSAPAASGEGEMAAGFLAKPASVNKKPSVPAIGVANKETFAKEASTLKTIGETASTTTVKEVSQKPSVTENVSEPVAKEAPPTKAVNGKIETSVTKTPPATATLKPGWYVQVAAAKDKGEAQSILGRLRAKGFNGQLESTTVRKERYLRVLVGPYSSKRASAEAQRKISAANLTRGKAFLRQIR